MDKNALKTYAPRARREFITAVTARAAKFGISPGKIEPVQIEGDFAIVGGTPFPRKVADQRRLLEARIATHGFTQAMEAAAYTWFNRFAAIRYMEINGYLEHGYRVLSHPAGKPMPEIVEQADHVDLPGLKRDVVVELKLDGRKDEDLYRMLLIAQCNALHAAMPFLFERIDDETELLLPDNLLHTDSLIRQMVADIAENDWKEIEIIGWLYQFYIAERKDEVIGKVVKSEDIPAATQLFTPNWIVKYMVQNTLGAKWLATYPSSPLKAKMKYYVEPAKQTEEVDRHLATITSTELDPEKLTMIDPACGSGHIIVEGYNLLKEIYLERGYTLRQIPRLILEKNLFGLDIDDRAAQLAGFALMMKARADDRSILTSEDPPQLNILAIQESNGLSADEILRAINAPIHKNDKPREYLFEEIEEEKAGLFSKKALAEQGHVQQSDISSLLELFEHAKTFGSLINVVPSLATKLPEIEQRLNDVLQHGDLAHVSAHVIKPLLQQAKLLSRKYDAVVANPPYMGKRGVNTLLRPFLKAKFPDSKADTYAAFIEQGIELVRANGFLGMVTLQGWMFTETYTKLRKRLLQNVAFVSIAHLGPRAFEEISGEVVQTVAFACMKVNTPDFSTRIARLVDLATSDKISALSAQKDFYVLPSQAELSVIPGSPFAYWLPRRWFELYRHAPLLSSIAKTAVGLQTGDNPKFLRFWHEVSRSSISTESQTRSEAIKSGSKWFPHNKGGLYRKWFGNLEYVVDWFNDGENIKLDKAQKLEDGAITENNSKCWNQEHYFRKGVSWTDVGSDRFGARLQPSGCIFDIASPIAFSQSPLLMLGVLNSVVASQILNALNPTLHFNSGNVGDIAFPSHELETHRYTIEDNVTQAVSISTIDWNVCETAWDFQLLPMVKHKGSLLEKSLQVETSGHDERFRNLKKLEEANNRLVIAAYGLESALSPDVPNDQITLYRPDRSKDIRRLLSFAIGCMMGRYSLERPGLIYAAEKNEGFEAACYGDFAASADGILPIVQDDWFADDASNRIREFLKIAWTPETVSENLQFIAESLGAKPNETPEDTIRRYLSRDFFKDHLQTYKNRPIYWLFSSGKEKAFECLVYLHRYNEGTLSRLRMEYVVPLQGRMRGKIEQFEAMIKGAPSTAAQTKLRREIEKLKKKQAELVKFDEELRHFADQRIELDLDDGVKVNYAKFGNLLSEVKKISGDTDE